MNHLLAILLLVFLNNIALASELTEEQKKEMTAKALPKRSGGLGAFGSVTGNISLLNPQAPVIVYGGQVAPEESSPKVIQHRLNITVPAFHDEDHSLAFSLQGQTLKFSEALLLDKNNTLVSKDFTRLEIGANYSHHLAGAKSLSLRGSVGSASDEVFGASRDLTYSLSTSYSYPGRSGYWIFSVFMSNNNPIANFVPIPGVIYLYKTEKFIGMFGLPLVSMQWAPVLPWVFSLSLFGPTITTEAAYNLVETTQIFTGFNWSQQSYMRHARLNDDDRLFLDEKRVYIGLRAPLFKLITSDFQVGQNFDRSVYEGEGFLNKEKGAVDLKNSWSLAWNFRYAF